MVDVAGREQVRGLQKGVVAKMSICRIRRWLLMKVSFTSLPVRLVFSIDSVT